MSTNETSETVPADQGIIETTAPNQFEPGWKHIVAVIKKNRGAPLVSVAIVAGGAVMFFAGSSAATRDAGLFLPALELTIVLTNRPFSFRPKDLAVRAGVYAFIGGFLSFDHEASFRQAQQSQNHTLVTAAAQNFANSCPQDQKIYKIKLSSNVDAEAKVAQGSYYDATINTRTEVEGKVSRQTSLSATFNVEIAARLPESDYWTGNVSWQPTRTTIAAQPVANCGWNR